MFLISDAYAQTAGAAPASSGGDLSQMLIILLPMMAVMFFFQYRSQSKKTKEAKALLDALAKGDEVVTIGGVLGRVAKLGETYIHLEISNNVELQVQRSAIVQILPKGTLK